MVLKACIVCGTPSPESRCDEHRLKPWANSERSQVTISGWAQQRRAKRILKRDWYCCHVCGKEGADQVDHIRPLSEGGADDETNLAGIHSEPCHREKTAAEAKRGRERQVSS